MESRAISLSISKKGEAIKRLHGVLRLLGYSIPSNEKDKKYFGAKTRDAVFDFQLKNALPATGIVDGDTLAQLEEHAKRKMPIDQGKTGEGTKLSPGMEGQDVALLHQLIASVGIEIDEDELKGQRFGATTGEAVRRLQLLAGLEPTGEVDRQIFGLLNKALGRLQVNPPKVPSKPGEYSIEGIVADPDGMPLAGATVVAVAHDLRLAREIGRSVTDEQGRYEIRCMVESGKPIGLVDKISILNLQLQVLDKLGKPLYTTNVRFNVSSGANIPIAIGGPAHGVPSEFSSINITLKPYLGKLRPEEFAENENFHDIAFLSGRTALGKARIAFYSIAARLANTTGLPRELFYGLFSGNIPPNARVIALASTSSGIDFNFNAQRLLNSILSTSDAVLAQAIKAAISKNIIPSSYGSRAQNDLASLSSLRTNVALTATYGMGKTPVKAVLDAAAIPADKQLKFMALYSAKAGDGKDFWKALGKNPDFGEKEAEALHFSVNVGIFAKGHMPLIQKLMEMRQQGKIQKSSDLARLGADQWKALLNGSYNGQPIGVPANLTAKTDQEAVDTFAHMLERNFERAYPTTAFSARLAEDKNSPFPAKERISVVKFLDANPGFNLFNTNVDRFIGDNSKAVAGFDRDTLRNALNMSKRLIKLTSRYAAARPLLADGIHSSQQIYRMGPSRFVGKYGDHPEIGAPQAVTIYANAEVTYALALSLAAKMNVGILGNNPLAVGNFDPGMFLSEPQKKDFPNLETLFGAFDFCACDQSRTVLSPAAYLVDMLHFLSHRSANATAQTVLDILLERRPDLTQIKLNSANTNTVLPYIDLVNELLEEAVAPPASYPGAPTALQRQTTLTTEELNANPQYVNEHAYEILADPEKAVFPWTLPFDLPLNEARLYLGQIGVDRVQLMRTFGKTPVIPSPQIIDIAIEGLLLSRAEADIICGVTGNLPWEYWGLNEKANVVNDPVDKKIVFSGTWLQVLSNVRILLARSGTAYKTLTQLLNTAFINPDATLQLMNDPPDSCCLDTMTVVGFTQDPEAPDRIHRFVRLMRRLDWDPYTLDSAIATLQSNTAGGLNKLNTTLLRQLYAVKAAMKRFHIPEDVAAALFGRIETRDIPDLPGPGDPRYSLYHKLFQNRAVLNPVDPVFDLNEACTEVKAANGPLPPLLADHKPALLGAFQISDADLALAIDSFTDGKLNLANLSALHRHVVLTNGLGLTIRELISLKALFETEQAAAPFNIFDASRPELLATFCDAVDRIRSTKFSIGGLDYLLRHHYVSTSGVAPDDVGVGTLLKSVLDGLNKIAAENLFSPDPTGTETRRRLNSLLSPGDVDSIMAILSGMRDADPQGLIRSGLGPYMDGDKAESSLVGGNALKAGEKRYEYVLKGLLAYLRRSQGTGFIVQQLSATLALPVTTMASFLAEWFPSVNEPAKKMLDDFLVLLDVVRDPSYNNSPITLSPEESGTIISNDRPVPFKPYFKHYMALDKAAKVVNGFGFSSDETDWLHKNGVSQGWLDLTKLPLTEQGMAGGRYIGWSRLAAAAAIKKTLPSDGTPFTSLMDIAKNKAKIDYITALEERTQWSAQSLKALCGDPADTASQGLLSLQYPGDYSSERTLARLIPAFALMRRLGISADVGGWTGPTVASEEADSIKQSVKAKYSNDQWLQIAKQLRDPLRGHQRDALVEYLLVNPPPGVGRWNDASDVYSYFLIDVEMSACQGTSRIVQANSAIQLFVLRCILNLEPGVTVDSNADTDWQQWQWMSRYRLWEANRKVFLYPENWIEPSLRRDKSPFMAELENDLLQNEVTKDTAEDALRRYLEKLDAVARLQVVGVYHDATLPVSTGAVSITIDQPTITLDPGQKVKLTAKVTGATNIAVSWTADYAIIDDNGNYIAPSKGGTYKVYARSVADPTKYTTATVNVNDVFVAIAPGTLTLRMGATQKFVATVSGTANKAVTWSATGGTIDSNGNYTAPQESGTYQVKATSAADPGRSATSTITVAGVTVTINPPDCYELYPGGQQQFTATVSGTANQKVQWTATKGRIDSAGMFTAPDTSQGYCTVKATSEEDPNCCATAWVGWA